MIPDRTTDKSLEGSIWDAAYSIRGAEVTEEEEEKVKQRTKASNPSVATT